MPWSPSQHRLFAAAAHNPEIARRKGISQSDARRMMKEGVKKSYGGLAQYADGGEVDEDSPWARRAGAAALGGAGVLAALARLSPRRFNALARPIQRALTRPVVSTEAVSSKPLSELQSDARYAMARMNADYPFRDIPATKGQGAWMGESGMELNPLYMQELPRGFAPISKREDALKYAAQLGQNLDQFAVPVNRAIPGLRNTPEGSNALIMKDVPRGALAKLAQEMGPDVVVSHRPNGDALLFSIGDKPMDIRDLAAKAAASLPSAKSRFAVSDPGIDRVLLGREPWMDRTYQSLDVPGATNEYRMIEDLLLRGRPSRLRKNPVFDLYGPERQLPD